MKRKFAAKLICLMACIALLFGNTMSVCAEGNENGYFYMFGDGESVWIETNDPIPVIGTNGLPVSISTYNGYIFVIEVSTITPGGNYIYGDWSDHYTPEQVAILYAAIDAAGVTQEMSQYDKCVLINNYICGVFEYNLQVKESALEKLADDEDEGLIALQRILQGMTPYVACTTYSDLYQTMCEAIGIECWLECNNFAVSPDKNHIWNAVCADGMWYRTDVTWNDDSHAGNRYLMLECRGITPWNDNVHIVSGVGRTMSDCFLSAFYGSIWRKYQERADGMTDGAVVPD